MPYKRFKKRSYRRRRPRVTNRRYPASVKTTSIAQGNVANTTIAKARGMYQDALGYYNKYAPIAVQAYKIGSKALEMLNAEKKYYDIAGTATTPSTPATTPYYVSLVSALTQGDGPTNRDGSQIRLKSVNVQMRFNINAAATTTYCRWLIVRDKRVQIGSTPAWTDIYDSVDVTNTFLNIEDQFNRFQIIRSGLVCLNINQNPSASTDVWIPCSLPVRYNTANQVIQNDLWLILASDEGTNTPTVSYRYRVRFYDN